MRKVNRVNAVNRLSLLSPIARPSSEYRYMYKYDFNGESLFTAFTLFTFLKRGPE